MANMADASTKTSKEEGIKYQYGGTLLGAYLCTTFPLDGPLSFKNSTSSALFKQ